MAPIVTSAIIFCGVFGGAIAGMLLHSVLPEHHLNAESKDVVKLGVGLVGTMAALVLGLLVASTKGAYDTRSSELTQMAANTILLDRTLAHYGAETAEIRALLKLAVNRMIEQTWGTGSNEQALAASPMANREVIYDKILELEPRTDAQRTTQSQSESIALTIWQAKWLLFEQNGSAISKPFLVVVVFWLTVLFASFGLFAPRNATVIVALLVSALSVAGAIFLILELDHPFSGLIQISNAPLNNAISILGK